MLEMILHKEEEPELQNPSLLDMYIYKTGRLWKCNLLHCGCGNRSFKYATIPFDLGRQDLLAPLLKCQEHSSHIQKTPTDQNH